MISRWWGICCLTPSLSTFIVILPSTMRAGPRRWPSPYYTLIWKVLFIKHPLLLILDSHTIYNNIPVAYCDSGGEGHFLDWYITVYIKGIQWSPKVDDSPWTDFFCVSRKNVIALAERRMWSGASWGMMPCLLWNWRFWNEIAQCVGGKLSLCIHKSACRRRV